MTRDEIVRGEMIKLMIESAVGKGKFMTSADIDMEPAAADGIGCWRSGLTERRRALS